MHVHELKRMIVSYTITYIQEMARSFISSIATVASYIWWTDVLNRGTREQAVAKL